MDEEEVADGADGLQLGQDANEMRHMETATMSALTLAHPITVDNGSRNLCDEAVTIPRLPAKDLKALCNAIGLPATGTKDQLSKKIQQHLSLCDCHKSKMQK